MGAEGTLHIEASAYELEQTGGGVVVVRERHLGKLLPDDLHPIALDVVFDRHPVQGLMQVVQFERRHGGPCAETGTGQYEDPLPVVRPKEHVSEN